MSIAPENESTIIKPGGVELPQTPQLRLNVGRSTRAAPPPRRSPVLTEGLDRLGFTQAGVPPLVAAALPLLNLAGRLRLIDTQPDLETLRGKVIHAVKMFEQKALGAGVPPDRVRAGHYALCATLDDIILGAPWGTYSLWARQSMVTTFHGDVTGGERFFDLLAHSHKDPGTNRDVLLLMYDCLAIGFEGRMRVHPQGHLELARIRDGLYRTLRGDVERELSPEWRGVDMRHKPLSPQLLLWTGTLLATLAMLALYFGLGAALDRRSDATLTALLQTPPSGVPTILRPHAPAAPATAPAPPRDDSTKQLQAALANEIKDGLATVAPTDGGARIRLKNEGLFEVGKAEIAPRFAELIDRIGRVLRGTAAAVTVVGYTDTTPIHTAKFPSNYYLSVGRADAVAGLLGQHVDPGRIRAEGRGAAEPVADNATAEGREQNRRTEIVVLDQQGDAQP